MTAIVRDSIVSRLRESNLSFLPTFPHYAYTTVSPPGDNLGQLLWLAQRGHGDVAQDCGWCGKPLNLPIPHLPRIGPSQKVCPADMIAPYPQSTPRQTDAEHEEDSTDHTEAQRRPEGTTLPTEIDNAHLEETLPDAPIVGRTWHTWGAFLLLLYACLDAQRLTVDRVDRVLACSLNTRQLARYTGLHHMGDLVSTMECAFALASAETYRCSGDTYSARRLGVWVRTSLHVAETPRS